MTRKSVIVGRRSSVSSDCPYIARLLDWGEALRRLLCVTFFESIVAHGFRLKTYHEGFGVSSVPLTIDSMAYPLLIGKNGSARIISMGPFLCSGTADRFLEKVGRFFIFGLDYGEAGHRQGSSVNSLQRRLPLCVRFYRESRWPRASHALDLSNT